MNIKIEPDDELTPISTSDSDNRQITLNATSNEEQSIDIKVETLVKQEEIIDEIDHHNTTKFQTTKTITDDLIEPPAITLSQTDLPSLKSYIHKVHIKREFLLREVNVVINLKNGVFYKRNFVCSVCYNIFPSSHSLEQHVTSHAKLKFDDEIRAKLRTNVTIELDDDSVSAKTPGHPYESDHFRSNLNDIKFEALDTHHKSIKLQTTSVDSSVHTELHSINLPQNRKQAKVNIHEQNTITTILQEKMVAIIVMENAVFNERNFVCNDCNDIFPSSNMLKQHRISHAIFKIDGKNCEKLKMDITIEPDHELLSSSNQDSFHFDCHQNDTNDILIVDHSIDIKHEALEVQEKIIEHENHHQSRKTKTLHSKKINFNYIQGTIKTVNLGSLKKHKPFRNGKKHFKRDETKKKHAQSGNIKHHTMSHSEEKPFKCDQCSYRTAVSSSLKRHRMTHTGEKPFKCDQCSYRTAESGNLRTHKMLHTGEKQFKCDICSYRTAISANLKLHNMTHTGEKPFKCDQCSFNATRSSYLKTHKMSHTGEKPFECDKCSFKTAASGHLKTHEMSHTGEKPFKCDQCIYRTALSASLKLHYMTHTGEKPFKCDQCIFKTTQSCNLKRHKMSHTGEKNFKCDQCIFKTTQSSYLKRHKMSHIG